MFPCAGDAGCLSSATVVPIRITMLSAIALVICRLLQLLTYELRTIDLGYVSFRQVSQQGDSLWIDEPYLLEIQPHGFARQQSSVAQAPKFLDPWADKVALQLKVRGLVRLIRN
jgi:hypothetical protein